MGEGGVAPDYFLHRMQWWEVNRYLDGLHRRYHTPWENTRALQWWLVRMFGDSKKGIMPNNPEDLYKFIWEENEHHDDISDDDYEYEQELIRQHNLEQQKRAK